ncbi:hypothetical protein CBS63078_2994 [Aspergillus niger]|nr:hypothetical protein CBS115989_10259 [Aspergillus niger]KAI2838954.1 hypothetical protein CBS11350_7872 [Aspergillus niger]KAI2839559.1 hypothetical protein CBS11232_9340 [Aspergillus niger]KAI2879214.1 hypothetical protein CBS115988_2370 [Aspergillus niger]KAI2918432.1 hypothetical protein CBS63078_2994 [Aspergillus niger]
MVESVRCSNIQTSGIFAASPIPLHFILSCPGVDYRQESKIPSLPNKVHQFNFRSYFRTYLLTYLRRQVTTTTTPFFAVATINLNGTNDLLIPDRY